MKERVCVFAGEELARYHFGEGHPFGPGRCQAFEKALERLSLASRVCLLEPALAPQRAIEWFHDHAYVEWIKELSKTGSGYLDDGDTPAFPGVYEAAATVAGTVLKALEYIVKGKCRRAFVPIAGLHHAHRDRAAGFCVFNDCAIAIEALRRTYGMRRIAYVDIDAHHGDGVFYGFEDDPELFIADLHEDGRYLYPGTGFAEETGKGDAQGTKLNLPLPLGAEDEDFMKAWEAVEDFVEKAAPEFVLLQCGADGLAGDPLTHLRYSESVHAQAAKRLCHIADAYCQGRLLALGGGGYALENVARAWCMVVQALLECPPVQAARY